ncbi:MAG: hypothetical protein JXQ29_02595 [Planctomycetes bacterium]|nr:hypothetical protein [Planctomycetota bacterium]
MTRGAVTRTPTLDNWRDRVRQGDVMEARRYVLIMGVLVLAMAVLAWFLPTAVRMPRWCSLALGGLGAGLIVVFFWSGVRPLHALLVGAAAITILAGVGVVLAEETNLLSAVESVVLFLLPVAYGIRSAGRVRRESDQRCGPGDSPPAA